MEEVQVPRKRGRQPKAGSVPNANAKTRKPTADELSVEERLARLRRNAAVIYDSFLHHNLQWGSLSVAWGGEAEKTNSTLLDPNTYPEEFNTEQTIYFAGRTDGKLDVSSRTWTGSPGELFVGRVAVAKSRTVPRTSVGKFQENHRSTRVGVYKRLIHPGEVNRIRSIPGAPHIIVTHSDSSTVFVWNTATQPNRTEHVADQGGGNSLASKKKTSLSEPCKCSVPDLELVGHESSAEFALDTKGSSKVLSAGSDKLVLMWCLSDSADGTKLQSRAIFSGHQAPVEDCSFRPVDDGNDQCCSVGQDRCLILWDARTGTHSSRVENIHSDDANCCSWSATDYILTGGSDGIVNVFDVRKLQANSPISTVSHKASVINVRWSPHQAEVFATSDEGANLTLYRHDGTGKKCEVLFQHLGHRTPIVDVQFNPINPWVLASVSDDSADEARGGGGTLQIWRISEFVHKSIEKDKEWASELEEVLAKNLKESISDDESGED